MINETKLENLLDFRMADDLIKRKYLPRGLKVKDTYFGRNENGMYAVFIYLFCDEPEFGYENKNSIYVIKYYKDYRDNSKFVDEVLCASEIFIDGFGRSRGLNFLVDTLEEKYFGAEEIASAINFIIKRNGFIIKRRQISERLEDYSGA